MLAIMATFERFPVLPIKDIVSIKQDEMSYLVNMEPMMFNGAEPDISYLEPLTKLFGVELKYDSYMEAVFQESKELKEMNI